MKNKPNYNVGDTVYYIKNNTIVKGEITAITTKFPSYSFDTNWFEYCVDGKEIDESYIFLTKSSVIRNVLLQLRLNADKVEFICKTLFPEEYQDQNQDDLVEEDFEKLDKPKEVLQIEEKTSFWKSLFN